MKSPDDAKVYIALWINDQVAVLDAASNTLLTSIAVGDSPTGLAITPNGSKAYVANAASNHISVIDLFTNTVTTTIAVGNQPRAIAISADGIAYVTHLSSANLYRIDTVSDTIVGPAISLGAGACCHTGIAISP